MQQELDAIDMLCSLDIPVGIKSFDLQIILMEAYAEKFLKVNVDKLFGLAEIGNAENMHELGYLERRIREYLLYRVHERTGIPLDRFFDQPPWFVNMIMSELRLSEQKTRDIIKNASKTEKEDK
jgi:hypothetical protein